jgi:hypothetical protein
LHRVSCTGPSWRAVPGGSVSVVVFVVLILYLYIQYEEKT